MQFRVRFEDDYEWRGGKDLIGGAYSLFEVAVIGTAQPRMGLEKAVALQTQVNTMSLH